MKIVVYTAIFGGIDCMWSILPEPGVEYVAFTDRKRTEVGLWGGRGKLPVLIDGTHRTPAPNPTWNQVLVEVPSEWGPRRTARHYKTSLRHPSLADADVWVWLDGNVRPRRPITEILKRYTAKDTLITHNHWDRDCAYQEAAFCAKIRKDRKAILVEQSNRYKRLGLPTRWGLAATRVVIRRNTDRIRDLNRLWWAEILNYSVRDQVSLPYCCWALGLRWTPLPGKVVAHYDGEFVYKPHIKRGR